MAFLKFFPINWKAGRIQEFYHTSTDSLASLGGLRFLVYLYAKAVSDGLSFTVQLKALNLLLSTVRTGSLLTTEAKEINLAVILSRILTSPQAAVNDEMLDVSSLFSLSVTLFLCLSVSN